MDIVKHNDITLKMEVYYGRLKIQHVLTNNQNCEGILICLKCNYGNINNGSIKAHVGRNRSDLNAHCDILSPSWPGSFTYAGTLNSHLYSKRNCAYVKDNASIVNCKETW